MADYIIETKGLNVGYGPIHVIYDLDFKAPDGEVTVIVGPNGVGKSSLLKAIMGTITMYSGQIFFQGKDITRVKPHERTMMGIGYMPQTGNIFSKLTVEDNLRMASYIMADKDLVAEKREMVMELFPRLKGYLKRDAGTLSGGERQMLAESMVLMRDPRVMLVDEPTAGLMPKLVTDVLKKLEEMAEQTGLPIIIVEQRARRALEVGDNAYLMRGGVFTFEGSAQELLNHPLLTEMYLGAVEVHDLKTIRE
ncbi:ABC transporter ATP-binding protein [Candidatus Bathyarchaeota archaeon]|nr:ABC transporter ATP-binding protein [Candidatus Bathyarchaeota archaeon]MBL7167177.1 ABC transporter ATP-binding protein [Candidatus Bathyarchaeota archaeon]